MLKLYAPRSPYMSTARYGAQFAHEYYRSFIFLEISMVLKETLTKAFKSIHLSQYYFFIYYYVRLNFTYYANYFF